MGQNSLKVPSRGQVRNALFDPEYWRMVEQNFREAGMGAVRGLATQLPGAGVDLVNMAYIPTVNAMGYNVDPASTVGSSAWFASQGDKRGMLPTGNSIPFRAGETLGPMAAAALPDSVNMLAAGAGKVGNALGSMASELGSMAPARGQVGAITYHGSPHKFDKFDMSKIGTGEGAQVYGHGLYFAENPEVARQYAEAGAEKYGDLLRIGRHEISRSDWRFDPAISAKRAMDEGESLPKHFNDKEYKWAEAVRSRGLDVEVAQPNMYQVDIPDEHIDKMLDWDKPLSEQPDLLQKLKDAGVFTGSKKFDDWEALIGPGGTYVNPQDSAQRAYIAAQQTLGAAKASELFKSAGIPGIKYLDAGSRGAGNGTRNFVLFDDQIPKILKRE